MGQLSLRRFRLPAHRLRAAALGAAFALAGCAGAWDADAPPGAPPPDPPAVVDEAPARALLLPCWPYLADTCRVLAAPWNHMPVELALAGLNLIEVLGPALPPGAAAGFLDSLDRYYAFLVFLVDDADAGPYLDEADRLLLDVMRAALALRIGACSAAA